MNRTKNHEKTKETLGDMYDTIRIICINKPITQEKEAVINTDNNLNYTDFLYLIDQFIDVAVIFYVHMIFFE